ncbi:hypothetical protein HDU92_003242 [Lobulomyces angularis]|nr:hypothetical protein HDU92_003242 [Lobulomyces angularis]
MILLLIFTLLFFSLYEALFYDNFREVDKNKFENLYKSLSVEYYSKYQRLPPPNFDVWTKLVLKNGCLQNLENYSRIYMDLESFFLKGEIREEDINKYVNFFRNKKNDNFEKIEFKNLKFKVKSSWKYWFFNLVSINEFKIFSNKDFLSVFKNLKNLNFKFVLNTFDEPVSLNFDNPLFDDEIFHDYRLVFEKNSCMKKNYGEKIYQSFQPGLPNDTNGLIVRICLMLPIGDSMKEPEKFPKVLTSSMLTISITFILVGSLGYITFGRKEKN